MSQLLKGWLHIWHAYIFIAALVFLWHLNSARGVLGFHHSLLSHLVIFKEIFYMADIHGLLKWYSTILISYQFCKSWNGALRNIFLQSSMLEFNKFMKTSESLRNTVQKIIWWRSDFASCHLQVKSKKDKWKCIK